MSLIFPGANKGSNTTCKMIINMHRKKKQNKNINKHHSVHNQNGNTMQCKLIRVPILNPLHVVLGCEFETR